MRCPQCNGNDLWERYDKNNEDKWVKEILCPICHYNDIIEVPEDESLEDFAERMSQSIQYSVKFDMINCFKHKREYQDGYLLEDSKGDRIKIDITITPGDHCDIECIHYISDYETRYDYEGNPYDEDVSYCELGKSAIYDRYFCKHYED